MLTRTRMAIARPLFALFLFSFFVISCRKENQVSETPPKQTEDVATLRSFLSEVTGAKTDKITFDDAKKEFTIDGDVIMSLKSASEHYAKAAATSSEDAGGRTTQRRYDFIMNTTVAGSVTIYADGTVPTAWQTAIDQAISNWNGTDCLVKLSRVTSPFEARIVFSSYTDASTTTIAFASFPDVTGNCGPTVNINLYYSTLSASRKQFAITHELGHCLGFMHTNQANGVLIPETPNASDPNSLMNAVVLDWAGYTYYDIISYGIVYPNAVNTKRLLRYYNGNTQDHFYTLNSTELNASGSSYNFEKGEGYMYTSQVSGSSPFYRYYNSANGDHFYTANYAEIGAGSGGYSLEGVSGYLFTTQVAGTRPLYRYFNLARADHFYTVNYSEFGAGASGYTLEGVAGYVY
ncbi:Dual-action HEIGH metallo-peptidase [Chitinophaga sp. CF118]|uniref:M57 family metalloprotease n=1 Tax=Chitinophaga sp. CF118 TaxID=1884367 RepID=UPI0008F10683|nr:M57 family metalloprotease [Chitinophaga sp. CF118]SFE86374.1 Dual-action HEIGH metallo-peptidase [Chitinophaga sp. CF118]